MTKSKPSLEQLREARLAAMEAYRATGDLYARDDYQRLDAWIALKRGFAPVVLAK